MRVLFVLPSLANKGPIIVAKTIVSYLVRAGIHCEVFYFKNIVEVDFPCNTKRISFFRFSALEGFDVVHSHGIRSDVYSFLSPARLARVSTLHSYIKHDLNLGAGYPSLISMLVELVWCVVLRRMDKVVTLSDHAKGYYRRLVGKDRLAYIYNGVGVGKVTPVDESARLKEISSQYKIVGTVSVLSKLKGLSQVIRALPEHPDLFFVVVGEGPEKDNLISLAEELGVEERCLFLGYKKNPSSYYAFFDIFVFPSYFEGFGLSLIEAASFGKPAVVSDIPIFREIFDETEVCYVQLDNKDSMVRALARVMEKRYEISRNVYNRYVLSYTDEVMGGII